MKTTDIIPSASVQQFLAAGKAQQDGCGMPQQGFTREQLIRRRKEQHLPTYYYKIEVRKISVTVYHAGVKTFALLRWQLLPVSEVFQRLDAMLATDVPQLCDALGADLSKILSSDFYQDASHFRAVPSVPSATAEEDPSGRMSRAPRKAYERPALSLISMQLEGMVACGASAPQPDRKRYVAPELRVVPFFAYAPAVGTVDADSVISDSTMEEERNHAPRKRYVAPDLRLVPFFAYAPEEDAEEADRVPAAPMEAEQNHDSRKTYVAPVMEVTCRRKRYVSPSSVARRKRYRKPLMLVSLRTRKVYTAPTSIRKAEPGKKVCWLFRISEFGSSFFSLKAWNLDVIVEMISLLCIVIPMFKTVGNGELEHGWAYFYIFCASFVWLLFSLGLKNPAGNDSYRWWMSEQNKRKREKEKFAEELERQRNLEH